MEEVEVLPHGERAKPYNEIPKILQYIGGGILGLNALYLGFLGLVTLIQVFNISQVVGIIMLFTAVGFIPFIPMYIGFSSIGWIGDIPNHLSKFEYWTKVVLVFIAGIVVPYIVYWLAAVGTLLIAAFLGGFVK